MPDRVETSLGSLEFFDGLPQPETVTSTFDNLDLLRGVEAFLTCVPGASIVAMRNGLRSLGWRSGSHDVFLFDKLLDSASIYLTGNTETAYGTTFLDLSDGPIVVESPPNCLNVVDDFWFRYVTDMGNAGPDRGQGGKYLFLPPGFTGAVPGDYFVFTSRTFSNWAVFRALDGPEALKTIRIYPLADAADPAPNNFISISGKAHCTVHANDYSFFEEIDQFIQEEPVDALDPETRGLLAAIGIKKGEPLAPDKRMRSLLVEAAAIGSATARSLAFKPRDPAAYYYPGSSWKRCFIGGSHEFLANGARLLDARTVLHYMATIITPAMVIEMPGIGSQYAYTAEDGAGQWLDGAKTYRMTLPKDVPAKNFWSVVVYDTQTRSLLQTDDPFPSLNNVSGAVEVNPDGSTDLYFGPVVPEGRAGNWIQTLPGKSWFTIFRLYGPLEAWFDQSWRPGEIELV
jgi:hypothetical protein